MYLPWIEHEQHWVSMYHFRYKTQPTSWIFSQPIKHNSKVQKLCMGSDLISLEDIFFKNIALNVTCWYISSSQYIFACAIRTGMYLARASSYSFIALLTASSSCWPLASWTYGNYSFLLFKIKAKWFFILIPISNGWH